jgi:hypothetical protein
MDHHGCGDQQVLAYRYEDPAPDVLGIYVYDPNCSEGDDAAMEAPSSGHRGLNRCACAGSF